MQPSRKKELLAAYKQRPSQGGLYCIACAESGKRFIDFTVDLSGMKNRFSFCTATGTPFHHCMRADEKRYGASAFTFEVLESIPQKEGENLQDYREGLKILCDACRSQIPPENLYV